jgi:Arc/MetJ-type ribon-helix-helix transcriptional regulator
MTINLPKDVENSIRVEVQNGHFASADEAIAAAWRAFQRQQRERREEPEATARQEAPPCEPYTDLGSHRGREPIDTARGVGDVAHRPF